MTDIILWSSVGILVLALVIGMVTGLVRGLKRSATHIVFLIASIVVAFLLTKTITKAILGITLPLADGKYTVSEYIIYMISKKFDVSAFDSASSFIVNLPNAIVGPIMFILLSFVVFMLFDIVYLIVARLSFGKKKLDFKENPPYRAFGGVIGLVEGLFMVMLIFGPLSSLTGVYKELVTTSSYSRSVSVEGDLKTISQSITDTLPKEVNEIALAWDKSVLGKLPKVFGLNNVMFDNLSSFKVKGEKIVLRTDLLVAANTYDEFVIVYNKANHKEYNEISLRKLKKSLTRVLDGNIFKVVISDSARTLVRDYEKLKAKLPFTPPALMDEIIDEISLTFGDTKTNVSQYLKEDILNVVDVFDKVFSNNLITKYNNIENKKDFIKLLEFVSENDEPIREVANSVISLNLVEDSFNVLADKASKKIEKFFEEKEHKVSLNTNIQNKSQTVQSLLDCVNSIIDLDKVIKISDILNSSDIIETLTGVEDIYKTMRQMGYTFDKVRNLELLVLPPQEEGGTSTFVFDNMLRNYGLDILGDEVYVTTDATEKTRLDNYTKFFDFISGPIDLAKDLGLTDLEKEGVTFESVFDRVLLALKLGDTEILTRIVTPFYQLNCMNIRGLVFDKIVNNLKDNVGIISLDEVIAINDYHTWVDEFDMIGETLNLLNTGRKPDGTSEIEGYNNTYIKYLLSEGHDLEKAMKALLENERLSPVLNNIFTAKVFKGLTEEVFDVLDKEVRSLTNTTGLVFKTDKSQLQATKQNTIETIEGVLDVLLSKNEISISQYGKILNLLKVNASNNGVKNGVFNNIFVNIIWYLTGDDLTEEEVFKPYEENKHKDAKNIKAFLNIPDYYADEVDYEVLMAQVENAINLANKLDENVKSFTVSETNTISDIVGGIEKSLADMTETEKVKTIEDLDRLLRNKNEQLLDNSYGVDERAQLSEELDTKFGKNSDVSAALKNLLNL